MVRERPTVTTKGVVMRRARAHEISLIKDDTALKIMMPQIVLLGGSSN
jgi:hypothetical protein